MNNKILMILVGVIVVGGGAFYAGMKYNANTRAQFTGSAAMNARFSGPRSGGGTLRGGNGGGFVSGNIIASDATSITVKLQDGSSKIILVSPSTPIMKSVAGTRADLVSGKQVIAAGTQNSDGSLTAESIQLRPASSTRTQ
ncbi:MAG: hypothetical protein KGI50_00555 [Patescibacteria group bacterium]|nr:hypothetical protein [Patescibacteria group bacterium]MDE2438153.1 hypothetical protein [Patescibacteria group bacterium]